jgi:arylsulfatase A-like enzyme
LDKERAVTEKQKRLLTRSTLLRRAAGVVPAVFLARYENAFAELSRASSKSGSSGGVAGMNVILFITDQNRAIQHFPSGWSKKNLPGMTRLQRHGLEFENAFTNACMCSPARSTMATGFFPAQTGVKYTLETDMPADQYPQVETPIDFKNFASVMMAAGYRATWKGKWHLNKPAGEVWVPNDVGKYGYAHWNPKDAGANQDPPEAGGGAYDNDGRFMNQVGAVGKGHQGALQYLDTQAAKEQPFFMVVSLVNPHDVLMYPTSLDQAGYDDSWLEGDIQLPSTVDEDLSTKPKVQEQFVKLFNLGSGVLKNTQEKLNYINFYANLMKSSDRHLVNLLNSLEHNKLLDETLVIATADHGEMGLAHGGLRQKNFNFYEESLRVPLVYSNPKLFPKARKSQALVSHVDLLPTLASLFKAPHSARAKWQGVDYSKTVLSSSAKAPQDYVVFTFDDWQSGQSRGPYLPPPNHIVSIRETRWKLAEYYDVNGQVASEWEMYDLKTDPLEQLNLAYPGYQRTAEQETQFQRLMSRLAQVKKSRLQPLPNTPVPQTSE